MFALLKWQVILSRKQIQRAKYMLIIWQNLVLNYYGFFMQEILSRDILIMFLFMFVSNKRVL